MEVAVKTVNSQTATLKISCINSLAIFLTVTRMFEEKRGKFKLFFLNPSPSEPG